MPCPSFVSILLALVSVYIPFFVTGPVVRNRIPPGTNTPHNALESDLEVESLTSRQTTEPLMPATLKPAKEKSSHLASKELESGNVRRYETYRKPDALQLQER